jgi:ubiquitin-conjugating enzyme E2 Q
MDLLTSDGWLPSYRYEFSRKKIEYILDILGGSISAVLMQIRLALSNLEPKPARLASDWNRLVDFFHFQATLVS